MLQKVNGAKSTLAGATANEKRGFDISKFRPATSTSVSRGSVTPGVLSVVNSEKNGKRVSLPRSVMERLNNPKTLQFAFTDEEIAVGERLSGDNATFTPRRDKEGRALIYAANLVREITEHFGLDFTNRVSITFHDVEYHEVDGYPFAIISVN